MPSPLRHLVLFSFCPDLTSEAVAEAVERFSDLAASIEEVRCYEWGNEVSPEGLAQGYTHCFLLSFDDAAGRDRYLVHPLHLAFVDSIRPLLTQALVADFVDQGKR